MESMGLEFTLAESTDEALRILSTRRFAAVISDMGRKEGPREGYKLLEAFRAKDKSTPFFIYAGSNAPQHRREAALRGAQGSTNIAEELVEMVTRSLPTGLIRAAHPPMWPKQDARPKETRAAMRRFWRVVLRTARIHLGGVLCTNPPEVRPRRIRT